MKDGVNLWQSPSTRYKGRFLQPFAIAVVCAVLIGLFLITGIMDLRRIDKTLVSFMENQGLGIVGVVQKLTQENLNSLREAPQGRVEKGFVPVTAFSPKQHLLLELKNLAVEVDTRWKADELSEASLRQFADENKLWLVAVIDERGKIVFQNRNVFPGYIRDTDRESDKSLPRGRDLLKKLSIENIPFIALQRRDRSGMVVIALDREGRRYWATKVSIEKVVEELGEVRGQHLSYIMVMDQSATILSSAGDIPEPWDKSNANISEVFTGMRNVISQKVNHNGKLLLDIVAPLYLDNQISGVVRLGLDREGTEKILGEHKRNIVIFMISMVLITLLSMWILYRNQNRHLAGIIEMERRLEKAERLSALGRLAAGVAHEIRNPLNAISMASQRLKRDFVPPDEEKSREFTILASVIRDEIRRLDGIIEEFLTFSRSRRLELHKYPIAEVLDKIVNLVREEAASRNVTIHTFYRRDSSLIPMDVDKLQQALLNIVKNAMESISNGGSITLSVEPNGRGYVSVRISDSGCGMTPEEIERIFNPEYTTKEKGLGLGLPLAHEIIRGHGGEIRVMSDQGKGTTFEILLPLDKTVNTS